MGRTSRWFRSLLGSKKPSGKRGGTGNNGSFSSSYPHGLDANKHAIVVAAATANAAEAALVAARAAAQVVRLTATSGTVRSRAVTATVNAAGTERRRYLAAVILQSAFRAYLARRALKALKGLVKLQALVRGHIVRKQSTYMLQRMQAMVRIQARACAHRAYTLDSPHSSNKSTHSQHPELTSLKTIDHHSHARGTKPNGSALKRSVSKSNTKDNIERGKTYNGSNWLDKWMEENAGNKLREKPVTNEYCDDEKSDKILEVDTWKPHMNLNQDDHAFQRLQHVSAWNHNEPIYLSPDALSGQSTKSQRPTRSQSTLDFSNISSGKVNQRAVGVAENSLEAYSASSRPGSSSSRRGPFIPARSECSPSFYSNYSGQPNYMTYTESSQAKVRSRSAPRQRLNSERPGTMKRYVHRYWDEETISEKGWPLHANFSTIAYPGTDSFEKFGYA